jgi:Cation transport ATPase
MPPNNSSSAQRPLRFADPLSSQDLKEGCTQPEDTFPKGLTSSDASTRLQQYGANSVEPPRQMGALRALIRQFESPIVLILVIAACISLVMQQWTDALIVLLIVLGSGVLGFTQEYRASAAIEGLKRRLALATTAVRDGAEVVIPVSEIVPGDVVVLSAGSLVPADGRVLEAQDFLVSESSITGESFPVEKRPARGTSDEYKDTVWLGSSVRSGTARVLVTATGKQTAFGAIAAEIAAREPEGDFARGVRHFGYLLIRVMFLVVLFVFMANLLLASPGNAHPVLGVGRSLLRRCSRRTTHPDRSECTDQHSRQ